MGQTSIKVATFINVAATFLPADHATLGFSTSLSPRSTTLLAIADTGCQSCLAGINAINRLSITSKDLIPITMQMHAVNNVGINILGAAILRFSVHSSQAIFCKHASSPMSLTVHPKFSSVERPVPNLVWSLATFPSSVKSCC